MLLLPHEIFKIAPFYDEISYFGFNFEWKSTLEHEM